MPSGYGFTLDPDSTNREHMYDSQPMSPKRARLAAVEVADHYVTALEPEWTVIDQDQRPDLSLVELREGDSSRGISIFVGVVTRLANLPPSTFGSKLSFAGKTSPAWDPGRLRA